MVFLKAQELGGSVPFHRAKNATRFRKQSERGMLISYDEEDGPFSYALLLFLFDDCLRTNFGSRCFRFAEARHRGPKDLVRAGAPARKEYQAVCAEAGGTGDRESGSHRRRYGREAAG